MENINNKNQEIVFLRTLVDVLSLAVNMRFMSPEHGSAIWKKHLKDSSVDVFKQDRGIEKRGGEDYESKKNKSELATS